jgi:hypothetical protein
VSSELRAASISVAVKGYYIVRDNNENCMSKKRLRAGAVTDCTVADPPAKFSPTIQVSRNDRSGVIATDPQDRSPLQRPRR